MARFLVLLVGSVLIASCSPPAKEQVGIPPVPPHQDGPTSAEMAQRSPASPEELANQLDLEEYPGATVVENARLSSKDFAPDEARYELIRKSTDHPSKIAKYYEEKLGSTLVSKDGKMEVVGATKRGNLVRVHIDTEGAGTKYILKVINYVK